MKQRFTFEEHQIIGSSIKKIDFNLNRLERKLLGGLPPAHNIMVDDRELTREICRGTKKTIKGD
jgi:hypothetical protein